MDERGRRGEYTLQWQAAAGSGPARGVALVVAGLNVAPGRMEAIAGCLAGAGLEVVVCALFGHGANFLAGAGGTGVAEAEARLGAMRRVSYGLWRDEVMAAVRVARLRCEVLGRERGEGPRPLVLAAFSLGVLIGCDAVLAGASFDRMVLLAPALSIRRVSGVLRLLGRWPGLVIPSATPVAYRANRGTAMAAYSALYGALADFAGQADGRLNVPTLVFCDPQDELVAYGGLERLVAERGLTRWSLRPVVKAQDAGTRYHHLVIDEWSVGREMWAEMAAAIREFVGEGRKDLHRINGIWQD